MTTNLDTLRAQPLTLIGPAVCPCCGQTIPRAVRKNALDVIHTYYRRKAAGARRVTLRALADETGYSYDYLRKVKRRYDADGKWGSKKAHANEP